jgi:hypothetical protein
MGKPQAQYAEMSMSLAMAMAMAIMQSLQYFAYDSRP